MQFLEPSKSNLLRIYFLHYYPLGAYAVLSKTIPNTFFGRVLLETWAPKKEFGQHETFGLHYKYLHPADNIFDFSAKTNEERREGNEMIRKI